MGLVIYEGTALTCLVLWLTGVDDLAPVLMVLTAPAGLLVVGLALPASLLPDSLELAVLGAVFFVGSLVNVWFGHRLMRRRRAL